MLRRLLLYLVVGLPVLLVLFVVLIAGFGLTVAAQDELGARVLWWLAMACLMLLVSNLLLAVGVVAVYVLTIDQRLEQLSRPDRHDPSDLRPPTSDL